MSDNHTNTTSGFDGWEVISSYTRGDAIADGTLVDAGPMAKEAGWRIPVALTCGAWADCVQWSEDDTKRKGCGQDETGRLWDVVWMAQVAVRAHIKRCEGNPLARAGHCRMLVYRIPREGAKIEPEPVELRIIVDHSGDNGELVATILQLGED